MLEEGYNDITNIDISPLCTKAMVQKYKEKSEALKYIQMDVKTMEFNENSFDAIIDKATFDSVLVTIHQIQCGENSTVNAGKMISQVYRVLKQDGVYIIISYGQPEYRLNYLEKPEF